MDQVFARSVTTKHSSSKEKRPMHGHGTSCSTTVDGSSRLISPLGHAAAMARNSQSMPMVDSGSLFLILIQAWPTGSTPRGFTTQWLRTDLFERRHRQSPQVASCNSQTSPKLSIQTPSLLRLSNDEQRSSSGNITFRVASDVDGERHQLVLTPNYLLRSESSERA
ncbi:unannotated protein [freshwater metagenome]|uniref:Unannotated protein n=1 Tax=freshwater metagenome TaxID=449393 RepID=A0A6J7MR42_9ZZZZ